MMVSRTPQQEAEENAILEQAAQIQAVRKAEQAALQAQRKAAAPVQPGASSVLQNCQLLTAQGVDHVSSISGHKVELHRYTQSEKLSRLPFRHSTRLLLQHNQAILALKSLLRLQLLL